MVMEAVGSLDMVSLVLASTKILILIHGTIEACQNSRHGCISALQQVPNMGRPFALGNFNEPRLGWELFSFENLNDEPTRLAKPWRRDLFVGMFCLTAESTFSR